MRGKFKVNYYFKKTVLEFKEFTSIFITPTDRHLIVIFNILAINLFNLVNLLFSYLLS